MILTLLKPVLLKVSVVNLTIMIGTALFGLYKGWNTLFQYGEAIALCGFMVIGIGTISLFGFWSGSRNSDTQYAQSVRKESIRERTQNDQKEARSTYQFQVDSILSGGLAVAIGTVLQSCFSG